VPCKVKKKSQNLDKLYSKLNCNFASYISMKVNEIYWMYETHCVRKGLQWPKKAAQEKKVMHR
jgi:hypothetical protein